MLYTSSARGSDMQRQWVHWLRAHLSTWGQLTGKTIARLLPFLRWQRMLLLYPVWLSFTGYIALWEMLLRHADPKADPARGTRGRTAFCLALSLTVGQFVLLNLSHRALSAETILFCALHGLAIQLFWHRGRRWCMRQLGVQPRRSMDPSRPFDGLDLGN